MYVTHPMTTFVEKTIQSDFTIFYFKKSRQLLLLEIEMHINFMIARQIKNNLILGYIKNIKKIE